jgi:hypothetical protein
MIHMCFERDDKAKIDKKTKGGERKKLLDLL